MKLLAITVFSNNIRQAHAEDVSGFNFFVRKDVSEHVAFITRVVSERTEVNTRQSVGLKDIPYVCHCCARENVTITIVADTEYPIRIAYSLIQKVFTLIQEPDIEDALRDHLKVYQDPRADKLYAIRAELDEVKDIMHHNIEELMKRGENLEILMVRAEELSGGAEKFYWIAKEKNRKCCKVY